MSDELVAMERRLAALEMKVAELQRQLELKSTASNWLEKVAGSMSDIPEDVWQEFQESCRQVRSADRPSEEVEEAQP